MATGVELGTAYLSLVASTRGLAPSVRKGLGGAEKEADASGKRAGRKFSGGIGGAIKSGAKSLVAPIGAALAGVGVARFFSDAVASASDFQEAGTKIEAIFGKGGGAVQSFAKDAAKNIGQSTNAALDAAGTFGVFGKSAGLGGKDLAKFSTDFVGLSTDLASFNNTSPEQAVEAIGAALRGESEPIRQYGVLLDDATLRNRALKLGLIKTTKEALTPQQKVLAAQAEIYAQTKDAQGDFAKTSGGLANQQRVLKAQFEDVKTQVGQFLLPILSKLAKTFTEKIMPAVRDFIQGWKDGSGAGGRFRDILENVWASLKNVATFVSRNRDVIQALTVAVLAGVAAFRAYRLISALTAGIKAFTLATKGQTIAQRALNLVMKANPIGIVITAIAALVAGLVWFFTKTKLGKKIIAVAWAGIKAAIKGVADWWTKTAWPNIKKVIAWFGAAFQTAKSVIAAAWQGIKSAAGTVWNWIKAHVIFPFKVGIFLLREAFRIAKEKIAGAWAGIKNGLKAGWNWIRDNVFSKMKTGVDAVKTAFGKARDGIKTIWDKLRSIAMKPVKFVVDTIYNNGIRALVGNVFGWLKKDNPLPRIDTKGWASGGWTGPGSKYKPAGIVHADEYVVNKASRRRIERNNPGALDYMNRTGRMPGYAGGGLVAAAKWWQAKGASLSEHPLFGGVHAGHMKGSEHYKGNAVDINFGAGTSAREQSFFDRNLAAFRSMFPAINTLWRVPNHFNHMHIDGGGGGSRIGGGGGFDLFGIIGKIRALKDKLTGSDFAQGFGNLAKGVGKKIIGYPIQWIKDQLGKFGDDGKGHAFTGNTNVQKQVRAVAQKYGWGLGSQWGALDWLINKESGWNPNAANPSSSARGLFQKMTSVHGPLESTVEGQAKWGLDYIKGRYGNPVAAQMFHQGHGYYANGGQVAKPKLYDNGGWLPQGLSVVENKTGKPEPILTNDQWERVGQGGGGLHIENLVVRDEQAAFREARREGMRMKVRNNMAGR